MSSALTAADRAEALGVRHEQLLADVSALRWDAVLLEARGDEEAGRLRLPLEQKLESIDVAVCEGASDRVEVLIGEAEQLAAELGRHCSPARERRVALERRFDVFTAAIAVTLHNASAEQYAAAETVAQAHRRVDAQVEAVTAALAEASPEGDARADALLSTALHLARELDQELRRRELELYPEAVEVQREEAEQEEAAAIVRLGEADELDAFASSPDVPAEQARTMHAAARTVRALADDRLARAKLRLDQLGPAGPLPEALLVRTRRTGESRPRERRASGASDGRAPPRPLADLDEDDPDPPSGGGSV